MFPAEWAQTPEGNDPPPMTIEQAAELMRSVVVEIYESGISVIGWDDGSIHLVERRELGDSARVDPTKLEREQ